MRAADLSCNGTRTEHSGRNLAIDHAKAMVIVLVVVGHAIAPMRHVDAAGALYAWVYAFHMPAFVLISGVLSQRWVPDERRLARLVGTLLVPYVVFQLLHAVLRTATRGDPIWFDPFQPAWTLWFLLALAAWRLLAPLLRLVRWRVGIAVVVSLVAGLSDVDQTLSTARILGFLPFFALGLSLRPEHLEALRRPRVRVAGGAVLLAGLVLASLVHARIPVAWFYYDRSYAALDLDPAQGLVVRSLLLVAGAVAALAVLAVVPARPIWWTYVGGATLYVYLLHAVLLYPLRADVLPSVTTTWGVALVVLGATALALLLGTRAVRRATGWLVEPPVDRLLRRTS